MKAIDIEKSIHPIVLDALSVASTRNIPRPTEMAIPTAARKDSLRVSGFDVISFIRQVT